MHVHEIGQANVEKVCASEEYNAPGIEHRLVIAHQPFTYVQEPPFDIEQDIYREWTRLIGTHIRPDFLLSGHLHSLHVLPEGGELDPSGAVPVVVGSRPIKEDGVIRHFVGAALTLGEDAVTVDFTDDAGTVVETHRLPLKNR